MNSRLHHLLLTACLLTTTLHAETRTFTSTAGTTIQGELVAVNGDMVTIKKADGQLITNKAANFSAADLAYLREHGLKPVSALAGANKDAPPLAPPPTIKPPSTL